MAQEPSISCATKEGDEDRRRRRAQKDGGLLYSRVVKNDQNRPSEASPTRKSNLARHFLRIYDLRSAKPVFDWMMLFRS